MIVNSPSAPTALKALSTSDSGNRVLRRQPLHHEVVREENAARRPRKEYETRSSASDSAHAASSFSEYMQPTNSEYGDSDDEKFAFDDSGATAQDDKDRKPLRDLPSSTGAEESLEDLC